MARKSPQAVLCADGVNGVGARAAGLAGDGLRGRTEAKRPHGLFPASAMRVVCLELANVPGGYGWVFLKGDQSIAGVAG